MRLITLRWHGVTNDETVTPDPTPGEVEAAVRALDGKERNDLYLTPDEDPNWGQDEVPWVGICGGPDVLQVSYNVTARGEYYTAVERDAADGTLEMKCGGQYSEFPRSHLVSPAVAVAVAVTFAATGKRLRTVEWEPPE